MLGTDESVGVVGFFVAPLRDVVGAARVWTYDHTRAHKAAKTRDSYPVGAPVPVWNFIVRLSSGETTRFRVASKGTKAKSLLFCGFARQAPTTPPTSGFGGSEGRGTFRRYQELTYGPQPATVAAPAAQPAAGGSSSSGGASNTRPVFRRDPISGMTEVEDTETGERWFEDGQGRRLRQGPTLNPSAELASLLETCGIQLPPGLAAPPVPVPQGDAPAAAAEAPKPRRPPPGSASDAEQTDAGSAGAKAGDD